MLSYIMNGMLSDQSTQEEFRFSVCCSECGNEWTCKNVRFSKAGIKPESEHKRVIYKTLYEKEKEAALNRALAQAEEMFSKCPICHRLVCDSCFLICEDLDMCSACARRLQEKGEPVLTAW